jgi:hypothetical protein
MSDTCCKKPSPDTASWKEKVRLYRPLLMVVLVSFVGAAGLSAGGKLHLMDGLMGFFFCLLALLKLFDLKGFAEGFAKYDVLAGRSRLYALAYPFFELILGSLFLSGLWPVTVNMVTVALMAVSSIGVLRVLRSGDSVQCACVGTGFTLPVGRVTLCENLTMGAMAAVNLLAILSSL